MKLTVSKNFSLRLESLQGNKPLGPPAVPAPGFKKSKWAYVVFSDTACQRTEIAPFPSSVPWMSLRHGCLHRQMSLQNQAQSFRLCCLSYKYQRSQQTNTSPRSLPASSPHIFGFLWEELYNNCLFIHPLTKSINMYWAPTVSKALCWMLGNTQQCVKHSSTVWGLLWGLHVSLFTEHWRR